MVGSITTAAMSPQNFLNHLLTHFFGLPQLQVLHYVGVSTFYNKCAYLQSIFRQLLCIPEIQSSVFISGSQVCILFLHFLNILSLCLWISVPAAQHLDTLCNIQYIFSYNKPMQPLETCNHIMYNCKHYQQSWNPKQQSLKDIITFLEFNQSAFCFQEGITYLSSNLV